MDINDVKIDRVYRFQHMHGTTPTKPVLVLSIDYNAAEVRTLDNEGNTGLVFPKELSEYDTDTYTGLVRADALLPLYSRRVDMLGKAIWRLDK